MRVAVVGNCQARPVGQVLEAMCPGLTVLPETIVHLSNVGSKQAECSRLQEADLILGQSVQDGYPADHLTTSALRSKYGSKLLVWPNLFFVGNCPDIVYMTTKDKQRVVGPLDAYHSQLIFECWREGVRPENVIDRTAALSANVSRFKALAEHSLGVFVQRERDCDLQISSYIADHWQNRRLFFTFNHPSAELMQVLCRRLADIAGFDIERAAGLTTDKEPLDKIIPPHWSELYAAVGMQYEAPLQAKGVACSYNGNRIVLGETQNYGIQALIDAFYLSYEAQRPSLTDVRLTPNYAQLPLAA